MTSSLPAVLLVLATATASADPCVIRGTNVSVSKVTVRTRSGSFDVGVSKVAATVTAAGSSARIDVAGVIGFKGLVTQKIWYEVKRGFTVGQVTFGSGANFVGDHAVGNEVLGSAVLHASDVMEGEDKRPDEAASLVAVHCDDLSLDWSGDRDTTLAGTSPDYFTRRGSSLMLHREPKDRAPGVTVATPTCEGEGCLFFELISRRGDWLELGVTNEGVSVVGWVRERAMKLVPEGLGLGFSYGCDGHHGGGTVMFGESPTRKHHTMRLDVGTPIYAASDGDYWATVLQPVELDVVFADGDRWGELRTIPGVDLGSEVAYVLVNGLNAPANPGH